MWDDDVGTVPLVSGQRLLSTRRLRGPAGERAPRRLGSQEPPFRPERPIVIQGGTLIDATGAAPKLDHAVVIEGERITWVGPMKNVKILDGAQVIDAQDMTIMPGLINSNQHIQLNPIYPAPRPTFPLMS